MPRYLTPQQVRAGGTGIPWAPVPNSVLADLIDAAETKVDAHMGFAEDDDLGFLPGVRSEKQPWSTRSFRVYPRCLPVPIRQVTQFNIVVSQAAADGSPVWAVVPPNLVIVNNDLGYCEVISTVVTVYGLVPVLMDLAASEPFVSLVYSAGYSIPRTDWPLYDAGDGLVFHSFRPQWDLGQPVSVSLNGVVQDPGSYTANKLSGTITFLTNVDGGDDVLASFTNTLPSVVTKATREAFLDAAEEWAANAKNMAGLELVKSGLQEYRRRKKQDTTDQMTWRQMLDGLKPFQMAPATNAMRT